MKDASFLKLRETKRVSTNLEKIRLDGSFCGFASIFGEKDLGNDIVRVGAFKNSLARRKPSQIRMLFQHDPNQPIGVWHEINETPHGLFVRGKITGSTAKGGEVLELLRSGAVDGLSIGFRTVKARKDRATNTRQIIEADLWEISIVTFPMQESARVETVKSAPSNKPTIREFERWLVRDAGLSRSDAKAVIADGYSKLSNKQDAVGNTKELAHRIRDAAKSINPNF